MLEVLEDEKKIQEFEHTSFPWQGVEEGVTFDQALAEVANRIKFEQGRQKEEFTAFLADACNTAETTFTLPHGASGSMARPYYHNLGHVQWILIHALKAEVGRQLLAEEKFVDLERVKLIASVALFHEVEEWWIHNVYKGYRDAITSQIQYFLQRNNIDLLNFDRVLALSDFGKSLTETLATTLQAPSEKKGLITGGELHIKEQDIAGKIQYLRSIAEIIRGADYAQCLDLAYQKKVKIRYTDQGTKEEKELALPAGSVLLALEFERLRPKALVKFGWGERGRIAWERVGPDSYFYKEIFLPDISPLLKYWEAYYRDSPKKPYSERLGAFETIVKETDLRISKLTGKQP
jgi:hypothetical protein